MNHTAPEGVALYVDTRQRASQLRLVLPQIALAVLIALRPVLSVPMRVVLSLALVAGTLYIPFVYTTGEGMWNYAVGATVVGATLWWTVTLGWLTDPMTDFRYLRDSDPTPFAKRPLYRRIWITALNMLLNRRLVGLNVQVANIPVFQGTRRQWFVRRGLQLVWSYIVTDACETFIAHNRECYPPRIDDPSPHVVPEDVPEWKRACCVFACAGIIYGAIDFSYNLFSLLGVALRLYQPEDWPDMFGSVSNAYTLRRFWGHTWHQSLQFHLRIVSLSIVRVLGIKRSSHLSSLVQLWVAFFLSGLMHSFGDMMVALSYFGRSMPVFLINAAGIMFEDRFLALAKALGAPARPTQAVKALGFLWVVLWFRYTLTGYVDWMMESGYSAFRLPFSLTEVVLSFINVV